MKDHTNSQKGQIMIISVMLITSTVLSVTVMASFLMLYHLRQSVDIESSAKAIFAADAGVEWELYRELKDANYPKPVFKNGAKLETVHIDADRFRSIGSIGRSARAFEVDTRSFTP
jgi:hypothetical protein